MSNYKEITDRIKSRMMENGWNSNDAQNSFGHAEKDKLNYLMDLHATFSYWSSVYNENDLEELKKYKVPQSVIEFYQDYEPKGNIPVFGGIVLFELETIKEYNSSFTTDGYLIKYGVITIGNTIGGNLICIDLNQINDGEPRVIGVDSNITMYNDDEQRIEFMGGDYEEDVILLSYEVLKDNVPIIAKTFSEFLQNIASENPEYKSIEAKYF
ncbi:SMI1/KNR4 family protein [Clostridium estertheticum]|uniref:SMI1/KNR4 family protein n=1 Tax=Clostridium estertheticum TaxID=238834 RepID=UPI001CF448A1|nr:SMI1/KNR4 family protein [Clostridium estertheticum]MCB2362494.1 SMI1/KNR4 family protein [Clostridium estertheticum]